MIQRLLDNYRIRILRHWLAGRRNGVSAGELLRAVVSTSPNAQAARRVREKEMRHGCRVLDIEGCPSPLYYPEGLSMTGLHHVVHELFFPNNWHYYDLPPMEVGPDDIVVDCGAAEGLFALKVAHKCRRCYIVEPMPLFIKALEHTFADRDNVEIVPVALGAEPGRTFIEFPPLFSGATDEKGMDVDVRTIDQLFFERDIPLSFLKCDLEGFDYEMLLGAQCTIAAYRPKIAITTYHKPDHAQLMERLIRDIEPRYTVRTRGIYYGTGCPVMLHAWVD